jgi:acyl-CoA synthetase (NDP forming)
MKMNDYAKMVYKSLFQPKSIVIVGASESLLKPGGKVVKNIMDHGYEGALWAVNARTASVFGLPTFKSIEAIPETPELAIIAIPALFVAAALEELGRKGTKAAIILTSGFGEKDEKGKTEERRLLAIAGRANMTLIGPNCSGFMTPHYIGKFAGIIPELRPRSVDFISGSGATVDCVMEQATHRGLSFCNVVNVGNSIQMGVEDILALYDENYGSESAPILMLYMEAVNKPHHLLRHARRLSKKGCTIVGIKSGVGVAGARAAASHTGAMVNRDIAVDALFKQAGIIRVKSKTEMIDVACVLSATRGRLSGKRVCVVTDAGGPGVMLTDELERQGLALPILGDRAKERLSLILPPESSVANPTDCLPSRNAFQIGEIFKIIEEEEKNTIDVIAIQTANPGMSDNGEIYEKIAHAMDECAIPIIPVLSSTTTCGEQIRQFTALGKCYFHDEVPLGSALGKVFRRPSVC